METPAPGTGRRQRWIKRRRNKASEAAFTILKESYNGNVVEKDHNCVGLGTVGDCRVIVEHGDYDTPSRIYIRDRRTHERAVFVLKGRKRVESITGALTRIAPKGVLRDLFGGTVCELTVEGGFNIDGEFVPFRNIAGVYRGEEVHRTPAQMPRD